MCQSQLEGVVSKILNCGEKLYCSFVDYQKAFDFINEGLLWQKLVRDGCSSTMIKALQAMYQSVKACVRYKKCLLHFLTLIGGGGGVGGGPTSPVLFILFVNDLLMSTSVDEIAIVTVNQINLFMLLYCDNAVLFAKSPECLQNMLNKLFEYSCIWDIKVNTE